jgi:aldehyde dehydrogenase (NAD+)
MAKRRTAMATTMKSALLPEVTDFLSSQFLKGLMGGRSIPSSTGATFTTVDPGSGEVLAEVSAMQADDVDRAVQAAAKAFTSSDWARLSLNDRGALLHRLADEVENRKPIIAQIESLDCGKVYSQAESDVQNFIDTMRYFVEMSLHIEPRSALAVPRHEAWTVRQP